MPSPSNATGSLTTSRDNPTGTTTGIVVVDVTATVVVVPCVTVVVLIPVVVVVGETNVVVEVVVVDTPGQDVSRSVSMEHWSAAWA